MSVKSMVRKAAFKALGCVEVPFGGKVGLTPEQGQASAIRVDLKPLWLPDDPRHAYRFIMHSNGGREATPEEAALYLELDKERIERVGLTFAEPGDPDGFLVKWKRREWDRNKAMV